MANPLIFLEYFTIPLPIILADSIPPLNEGRGSDYVLFLLQISGRSSFFRWGLSTAATVSHIPNTTRNELIANHSLGR